MKGKGIESVKLGTEGDLIKVYLSVSSFNSKNDCLFLCKRTNNFKSLNYMATITLKYNPRDQKAKKALEFMLSLGFFETSDTIPALDKSLKEVKEGKVTKYDSVDDFFKKIS